MQEYSFYIHTNPLIISIDSLLSDNKGIGFYFKDSKSEFLNYDGGTGKSNLDRVYEMYNEDDKINYPTKNLSIDLLKLNTGLIFPKDTLNREILSISGKDQFQKQGNFNAFYASSLLNLLKDPLYKSNFKYEFGKIDSFTSIYPYISVWIYCGSLGKIIDVTPFIISCNINVGFSGGSFSITLPPVILNEANTLRFNDEVYNSTFIGQDEFYFHKYIQNNDIVFIKFEKLDLEKDVKRLVQFNDFIIDKSVLANQVYDMIGLVDMNNRTVSYEGNEAVIQIEGRDLMKLFQDDGSYFMPLQFVENSESLFINLQDDDKLLKRTFIDGSYQSLFAFSLRDIPTSIQFIINQLANLGIVGDDVDLFSSYGTRRTKVYRLEKDNPTALIDKLHEGIWQIVKLVVDENVGDRRVADSSISQPDGTLYNQLQKLCQDPFVEFFGDTYGDTYNLIVRQPPFAKSHIMSALNGIISDVSIVSGTVSKVPSIIPSIQDVVLTIKSEDVISENLSWEDSSKFYCWYEITPQGSFIGAADAVSLAFVPVVYIPQYANKWGMKKLSIVSNYISNRALTGLDSQINTDKVKEAIINDFKYLIDSNSYLPFTRKGIIITNGDRRYKHGTWIRYENTGEIFYVDSVSNDINISESSIDRTTTLIVSRGLVEKYTKGRINYFDIVNTEFITQVLIEQLTSGGKTKNQPRLNIKSNFSVNQELFDFFYSRKQFEKFLVI